MVAGGVELLNGPLARALCGADSRTDMADPRLTVILLLAVIPVGIFV